MDNHICNSSSIFNSNWWIRFHDRSSNGYVTCKVKAIFIACNLYSTSCPVTYGSIPANVQLVIFRKYFPIYRHFSVLKGDFIGNHIHFSTGHSAHEYFPLSRNEKHDAKQCKLNSTHKKKLRKKSFRVRNREGNVCALLDSSHGFEPFQMRSSGNNAYFQSVLLISWG